MHAVSQPSPFSNVCVAHVPPPHRLLLFLSWSRRCPALRYVALDGHACTGSLCLDVWDLPDELMLEEGFGDGESLRLWLWHGQFLRLSLLLFSGVYIFVFCPEGGAGNPNCHSFFPYSSVVVVLVSGARPEPPTGGHSKDQTTSTGTVISSFVCTVQALDSRRTSSRNMCC